MKIPKQIMIPYIGALWEMYVNVAAMFSMVTFVMMTIVTYSTSEKVRSIFPSYWLFLSSCILLGVIGILFYYVCIIPSKTKFQNDQALMPGRNLLMDKVCEMEKILNEIKEKQ